MSSLRLLLPAILAGLCQAQGPIVVVSAASYQTPLAPAAIASLFGSNLSSETAQAQLDPLSHQLPTVLGGVSIQAGGQDAQLLYVSPLQINFVMPASLASGTADIVVQSKSLGLTFRTTVEVRNTAPGLFSLNQSGAGSGAILNAVTFLGGSFLVETTANLGDDKRTRLAIYGTGIRYAGNPFLDPAATNVAGAVKVQARDSTGNISDLPVEFAGAAPVYFGLDQVNVVLPPQLDGAGLLSLTLTAENASSNIVTLTVDSLPDSALRLVGLSLAQNSVSAGSSVNGALTLNAPARASGFPVSLTTTSSFVQPPSSVTVPEGKVSADFTLLTSSSGGGSATIVAAANNVSRSALLTVNSVGGPALATLTLSAASITGGISTLTGTVTLSGPAQAGGAQVSVAANPTAAQPPAIVTIPFGQASATFTIPTTAVTTAQMVTITASFGGTAKTAALTINPLFTFSLAKDSVISGGSVTGTVTLGSPAPFGGANVHFMSSRPPVAMVQQALVIPGGQTSGSVTISTGAMSVEKVTITAEYLSISQSATLTVIPVGTVSLAKVDVNPTSVKGGNSATGTVTLTVPAGVAGVTVTLQNSNTFAAQVQASVTVSSNQTTATFPVQTFAVTTSQTVTITASGGGVTKTATLVVQ
jgi:uncharacterized protein (TIGR03437 family)